MNNVIDTAPSEFRAPWWLHSPHVQTVAGKILRRAPATRLWRERWQTPDGDFLDLDFAFDPQRAANAAASPICLVLHGLEGSARRPYALLTYHALARRNVRAVGLNFRGCSGEPNRLPRFYHSGDTDDARLVLERLHARWPAAPLGAIGFSLGGNVLLKLAGEMADAEPGLPQAAIGISVPFDLAAGARALEHGTMSRLYSYYFLHSLRGKLRAKANALAGHLDLERALAARTMREFDDAATAPLHGFADAADYYRRSSSAAFLARIRVPTLLLQAEDDPFQPRDALPRQAFAQNASIEARVARHGGHVGFVTGPPWAPGFWAEEEAARFVAAQLGGSAAPAQAPG
jgi:uncharacterized protein